MLEANHRPVLLQEVIRALGCAPGGVWVDGTLGGGGHAAAILEATAPDGRLFGVDRDAVALEFARRRVQPFGDRVVLQHADFRELPVLLDRAGFGPVDGAVLDLGISSMQIDDPGRGFSFLKDGPLDMRMDATRTTGTAADLVNTLSERNLARLLRRFGEEPAAGAIAHAIVRERSRGPITSTIRLAAILTDAVPHGPQPRLHPATRTFQAIRISVNQELEGLDTAIEALVRRLRPGGRLAIISFHSLEDRIAKQTFRAIEPHCMCPPRLPICACGRPGFARVVTRRPIRPDAPEIQDNPRSRSARLRVVERLSR